MKRFYPFALFTAMALTLAVTAGAAMAQQVGESGAQYGGHYFVDLSTGSTRFTPAPASAQIVGDVYDNTTSPALFGASTTDLNGIYGDRLTTTGAGILDQHAFSVFNSGSSAGPLLTASYLISFYDGPTGTYLGGYTTSTVNFGAGLGVGFYSVITVTGLSSLSIGLPTDIVITQKIAAKTGTASRMGIVSFDPPTIGSSPSYYYVSNTALPAGFYTSASGNANPGYRVNVISPVPTKTSTWGMLKNLYR